MAMASSAPQTAALPRVWNLPNILTASRLGLAIVLFALIAGKHWAAALTVFVIAATTDWLDGYIARKQGLTSAFGRNFDPLVDKVLVCGAFIFLLPVDGAGLSTWIVTLVVARELVITGLRSFFESRQAKFGADWLGKLKMVLQCAAIIAILGSLAIHAWGFDELRDSADGLRWSLIWAMAVATALSGIQYLWRAAMLFQAI